MITCPEDRAGAGMTPPASSRLPAAWAFAVAGLVLLAYVARGLVLLLLIAAVFAYIINPLVKLIGAGLIRRTIAVTVVFLSLGAAVSAAAYHLYPHLRAEVSTLTNNLPFAAERLDDAIDEIQNEIARSYPAAERWVISRQIRYERLNALLAGQAGNLPSLLGHIATIALALVLIPFFSFFFLRDSRKVIQLALDRLPARHIETSVAVFSEIDRIVGRYLRGVAFEGIVIGVAAGLGLWLLGVQYPLLLGLFSAAANVVPYLGPIAGGSAAMLVALVQFRTVEAVANVFLLYAAIKLIDVVAIQPIALGGGKELHPALLVGSIIAGGQAFGLLGMIVAVPVTTIIQKIALLLLERRRHARRLAAARSHTEAVVPAYVC